jgi:hypothetical protein
MYGDVHEGDRIELHPATDRWMSGERFATVKTVYSARVLVVGERSGKQFRLFPRDIVRVIA